MPMVIFSSKANGLMENALDMERNFTPMGRFSSKENGLPISAMATERSITQMELLNLKAIGPTIPREDGENQ